MVYECNVDFADSKALSKSYPDLKPFEEPGGSIAALSMIAHPKK
jgi:hypothetical protein